MKERKLIRLKDQLLLKKGLTRVLVDLLNGTDRSPSSDLYPMTLVSSKDTAVTIYWKKDGVWGEEVGMAQVDWFSKDGQSDRRVPLSPRVTIIGDHCDPEHVESLEFRYPVSKYIENGRMVEKDMEEVVRISRNGKVEVFIEERADSNH